VANNFVPNQRMKTYHLALLAPLLIGAFSSLRAADDMTALRADFEKTTAAFHQALRTNDADSFFVYVADDAAIMPPNEAPVRGKAPMRTWYSNFLSAFRTTTLTLIARETLVDDNWATELGQYEWTLKPAAGGSPVIDKGNYMQIWKRQPDGHWLFFREIWNSSIPLPQPTSK
jgi:ketosteroid isomerase-like protein